MQASNIPVRNQDVLCEEFGEEKVVYNASRHEAVYLNQAAAQIWDLCDSISSVQQIMNKLDEIYPDNRALIQNDLETAIGMLTERGLVHLK